MKTTGLRTAAIAQRRRIFERTTKHRPRVRLTIRQCMRVLDE
jgi:hypothetical protein